MKVTLETDAFAVFDDALPEDELAAVRDYIAREAALRSVHADGYEAVWHYLDGVPYASASVVTEVERRAGDLRATTDERLIGPTAYAYPSDCAVDRVVAAIVANADRFAPWVGAAADTWNTLSATAFVYPMGTGLDWHTDDRNYTGAYTLYAHAEWKPPWGGELLLSNAVVAADDWSGHGTFVVPRPNRLVVLRAGTLHKIHRVSPRAGDHVRRAISGFFDRRRVDDIYEFEDRG